MNYQITPLILPSLMPISNSKTLLQSDYQVKIDSKTFDLMLDCLIANAGGDAACKLLLEELKQLGLCNKFDGC